MSTRAVYGFKDEHGTHWVYVHHDGYPTGAADKFADTLKSGKAWPAPRFEADEFGAAFVAANKHGQGSVRLTSGPDAHGDIEYVYLIEQQRDQLFISARRADNNEPFFSGPLNHFIAHAAQIEEDEFS